MIDSHTHLDSCEPPDDELVARASMAGVRRMLTVGTDHQSRRKAMSAAERFDEVYAAIGHHPNHATGFGIEEQLDLLGCAKHPKCVAIGETGLDYYRDSAPPEDQMRAFRSQIELARELDKPLIIHTRAADDDTIDELKRNAADLTVILHCFSMGDRVSECVEAGWFISFAGNVTYPSATAIADACEQVPADRILVETDAPYLTPQVVRKERNRPEFVIHTARFVAQRRGETYEQLEQQVEKNAAGLFGW